MALMRRHSLLPASVALGLTLLAGCLPGQQRTTPRELFPVDSLSRQLAEATPEYTMDLVWRIDMPGEVRYPLTLSWDGDRVAVADLQHGGIHSLTAQGRYVGSFADDRLEYPLLAGVSGDTVAVLSRRHHAVHLVTLAADGSGAIVETVPIPEGRNAVAAWTRGRLFAKIADQRRGSRILELGAAGETQREFPLDDPFWQHMGFLRAWGDTLISIGGYRPVVRAVALDAPGGTAPDSLYLMGFDSPQLERSRLFALGDVGEPPLLVPSEVAVGGRLFVLNARPGWAHVDVFRAGETELVLEASLLSPDPAVGRNYFAGDLAVRKTELGYDVIVLETRPQPALVRYRWVRAEASL